MNFSQELREQRWDDHRYYHHNRINQSLHLFSACCFLAAYIFIVKGFPVAAALTGWLLAMTSRQVGHFFFEPKDYDVANQASHEYKEAIKVGYNLSRKVVLLSIWALSPVILYFDPSLFGIFKETAGEYNFLLNLSLTWIFIGMGAIVFRMVQLFFESSIQTGLVWGTKILTDPFHDLLLYYKAPWYVLRGEFYDSIVH